MPHSCQSHCTECNRFYIDKLGSTQYTKYTKKGKPTTEMKSTQPNMTKRMNK